MFGERSSVFKSVLLNPLVWTGLILTLFTLEYNEDDLFGVFLAPETYRNLAIAAAIYVGLFGRKYTEGMHKLDWNQTLGGVLEAMVIVTMIWFSSLFAIALYRSNGESYSDLLRSRFQTESDTADRTAQPKTTDIAKELKALENIELKSGQKYKVTPNDDGSFTIEIE